MCTSIKLPSNMAGLKTKQKKEEPLMPRIILKGFLKLKIYLLLLESQLYRMEQLPSVINFRSGRNG